MTLYEIDEEIQELLSEVDPETGELITDYAALDALLMEREAKIENIVLFIKNLSSDVRELKAEESALAERREKARVCVSRAGRREVPDPALLRELPQEHGA